MPQPSPSGEPGVRVARWTRRPELVAFVTLAAVLRLPRLLARAPIAFDDGVYLASVAAMRAGEAPVRDVFSSQGPASLPLLWLGDWLTGPHHWGPRVVPVLAGLVLVCAVVIWTGRLQQHPGLRARLPGYRDAYRDGPREVLVRDAC